jgi:phosphate transport system substrate-binding protein
MKNKNWSLLAVAAGVLVIAATCMNCGPKEGDTTGGTTSGTATTGTTPEAKVSGEVLVDGSSTVFPISEAVGEEFSKANPDANAKVGSSGTGGGFKKFINGELDIAAASRPIEEEEVAACKEKGIEFVEIPIAFDGLTVVVNPKNDFVSDITVEDLKKIWQDGSTVKTWKDVRPEWPAEEIKLYGAGTDSGTFDYFTKVINGKEKSSRKNYTASEDDNTLVQGVAGDTYSLGYFGYAYYEQSKDKLKALSINGVAPSPETIGNGTYTPLSRPLFWYINKKSLEDKPQVAAFVKFLLSKGAELVASADYIPLPAEAYTAAQARVDAKKTGTLFHGAQAGMKIEDVLKAEGK